MLLPDTAIKATALPFSKRTVFALLFTLLLVTGIPLTLFLIQQETKPESHAASSQNAFAPSVDGVPVAGPALSLKPGVKILVDASEPAPIQKAVADLQEDMQKVLGQKPVVVATMSALSPGESAIVITYQGTATAQFRDPALTGEENHEVSVRTIGDTNYAILQGADLRGTLYAIYTFSDKYVGVPPLWYWSSWTPVKKQSIDIPANGGIKVGTPQTKYRAWFLNNQDLWGKWAPTADKYDMLFQTMLRLKLNTFYIGSQVGEYGGNWLAIAQQAQNRGLHVAANDLATFGKWDTYWKNIRHTTPPALTLANARYYTDYWKYSIDFAKEHNLDVLWVLGFRGTGDSSFWSAMADAPQRDEQQQGQIIAEQVARQAALVRQTLGIQHPKMAFLIWNELSRLVNDDALQLPVDPDLIWIFGNDIRDHFPMKDSRTYPLPATQPYGYYMNLQFYSSGSHLAEGEGPWKMTQNFKIVQGRRPGQQLAFAYLNMGNVREFLLTGNAAADMMWNIENYNPDTGMQKILGRYFGVSNAASLTSLYHTMLNAYWQQKKPDVSDIQRQYIFHDLRVSLAIKTQLVQISKGVRDLNPFTSRFGIDVADSTAHSQVGAVMLGSNAAADAFHNVSQTIDATVATIPANAKLFYQDTFQSPAHFLADAYRTLYLVTRSHFKIESDKKAAYCYLKDAQTADTAIQADLMQSAHGDFASWYTGESLFGLADIRNSITAALKTIPQTTCADSADEAQATPTPAKIGDLTIKRFVLTDSRGNEKTTFAPNEAIYPKVILANQGTAAVTTPTHLTYTQFYANAPVNVAPHTVSDVNVYLKNGEFSAGYEKEYGASLAGPNNNYYKGAKYWKQGVSGTYTARAFINSEEAGSESTFSNNQLTATYTIGQPASPTSTPTPLPAIETAVYPDGTSLHTSSIKDAKNTLIKTNSVLGLSKVACYNCGSSTTFTIYASDTSFQPKVRLLTSRVDSSSSSWYTAPVNLLLHANSYYIISFTPSQTPVYWGSTAVSTPDLSFLHYATAGAPNWKTGSWQIRLTYTK